MNFSKPQKRLTLLIQLSTLLFSCASFAATPAKTAAYEYPFTNQYLSTLTGAVAHSTRKFEVLSLDFRPERRNVPFMENRQRVSLRLLRQPRPAPLMFVIPGLGGYSGSGGSLLLAETFFDAGYSVVTLPNTMSWQYTVGVSESARPGYMPRDAKEYYRFLQTVNAYLQTQKQVQVNGFAVAGSSLGGLLTAFVAHEDSQQRAFNFQKVIIINPAIDVSYGIQVLDGLEAEGNKLSPEHKFQNLSLAMSLGSELISAPLSPTTFKTVLPKLSRLNATDVRWMIGYAFRQSVRDVVVAGQRVHDTGVLKSHGTRNQMNSVLDEAERLSFHDYMKLVVLPSLSDNSISEQQALDRSSLYAVASVLKNPRVFVLENADDLIVRPTDLEFLKSTMGERLTVYPYGGHLGNIWFEKNRQDLLQIARP